MNAALLHLSAALIVAGAIASCGSGPCGRDSHPSIAPEVELPKPVFLSQRDRAIQQAACGRIGPLRRLHESDAPLCFDQSLNAAARACEQREPVTETLIELSPAMFVRLVFMRMLAQHLGWLPCGGSR